MNATADREAEKIAFLLLLAALSTLFLFGNLKDSFYWPDLKDIVSADYLSVSAHLSPENNFFRFSSMTVDHNNDPVWYRPYNRFPVGGYAAIKLAILPFEDDASAQILAARLLMQTFFAASVVFAFLALLRLSSSPWIALAATLLAFSSFRCLYMRDGVMTEVSPDLFGVMLAFHGLVVFVQEERFRQAAVKICVALLLGWHVYALLTVFFAGAAVEYLLRRRRAAPAERQAMPPPARFIALGAIAFGFGVAILFSQLFVEYLLSGSLDSLASMLRRIGADREINEKITEVSGGLSEWGAYFRLQSHLVGEMMIPFGLRSVADAGQFIFRIREPFENAGALAFTVSLLGVAFVDRRHRALWAALASMGVVWGVAVRNHVVFHYGFEILYHVGVPLTLFAFVLMAAHRVPRVGRLIVHASSSAALALFVFSAWYMGQLRVDTELSAFHDAAIADVSSIRRIARGKTILVPDLEIAGDLLKLQNTPSNLHISGFYFSGSAILRTSEDLRKRRFADFIVTVGREPGVETLTPGNRMLFLYDRAAYDSRFAALGKPIATSTVDVYFREGKIVYVGEGACGAGALTAHRFKLSLVFPVPGEPRHEESFDPQSLWFESGGKCVVEKYVPAFDVERVETGQYTDEAPIWSLAFAPALPTPAP